MELVYNVKQMRYYLIFTQNLYPCQIRRVSRGASPVTARCPIPVHQSRQKRAATYLTSLKASLLVNDYLSTDKAKPTPSLRLIWLVNDVIICNRVVVDK